ncbi:class III extradiol ring-cleavage dioxygenase [Paucibacter sediminis]|uniref:Class III extradiol ring-cleavage dioxygenase n=1 Tax=Paucibacter sediminis TaxID=3019553 RepID=A0AA95N8D4_9BURK|nr:class III extradiol ring-cleavage dioxygenase [Paucibacter sp. S2-9]WIT10272.1 class III extradiol ring-cleavage dioxygenase [Paucibacter sp. S2-9]
MSTSTFAPLFVSHGSPMTALQPGAAGAFWRQLGAALQRRRPRAILALSAHTLAREPLLLAGERQHAVYDFGGFDPELYTLRYDAPGAPGLAAELLQRLGNARVRALPEAGLDHGIWTVLRFMFPDAEVPVLPMAWSPRASPAELFQLGQDLAPLAEEGVLIIGSGSITHNLRRVFAQGMPPIDAPEIRESAEFRAWMLARSAARDWDALLDYRQQAPHAVDMHPTDEHLLPWFIAAGAGGRLDAPQRLHDSLTYGCLGMDAYAFGPEAAALAEELPIIAAETRV